MTSVPQCHNATITITTRIPPLLLPRLMARSSGATPSALAVPLRHPQCPSWYVTYSLIPVGRHVYT